MSIGYPDSLFVRNMSAVIHSVRNQVRRLGWDLVRVRDPRVPPLIEFLRRFDIDLVIDVGANVGQFGNFLRESGYAGRILSIEPNREAFEKLETSASAYDNWECIHAGLGESNGVGVLNVSELSVFSSLLEPLESIAKLDERSAVAKREAITIATLDDIWIEQDLTGRVLLKLDTQGYERPILLGARNSLEKIVGLQLELSLEPIYEGQPRFEEMIALLRTFGFSMYTLWPGFDDRTTGAVLEVDGLFFRR